MKSTMLYLLGFFLLQSTLIHAQKADSSSLEIRFQPDSIIYVYENVGPEMTKQLFTAVIQNMAFVNTSDEPIIIEKADIHVKKAGKTAQTKNIASPKISASASKFKKLQEYGVLKLYDFQFQTSKYLEGVKIASNDTLKAGEALIIAHETFLFDELPDTLEVLLTGRFFDGEQLLKRRSIKIINHISENDYILPLKGIWTTAAGPSLIGHHRWGSIQEFAYDFIKIGELQKSFRNMGTKLEDYYAYGEPIYAIGDGVVVSAVDGIKESSDNLKRPDESETDYLKRMKPYQDELMAKSFQYIFGNHIVVRHPNDEFSSYFHLKNGSVPVKPGDVLKKGQLIGQVGHSGNSTEPHLHFHVSDGSDIAYSRSIPVEFSNVVLFPADDGKVRHIHSGQILKTKD